MPLCSRVVAVALCAAGVFAAACTSKSTPPQQQQTAASPDVWAIVDGRNITRDQVEKAYRRTFDPNTKPSDDEAMTAKLTVLNDLILQDLLLARAKSVGIEVTGNDIETAFAERKKSMTEDAFEKQLAARGLTASDLREDLRRELTTQKLIDREINGRVNVSDSAVADYFNANRAQFNLPETGYHVAQIVVTAGREEQIANRKADDATTPEAAAQKVKMLNERLKAGADFAELAMDYSEDPQSAPRGGDLGLISATQLKQAAPALRDAVLKGQPGSVTQVAGPGGYTLVLFVGKEPAGQRDLSSPGVRDTILATLRERQQQLLQTAYFTRAHDDARIENVLAKQIVDRHPPAAAAPAPSVTPAAPGKKTP